MASNRIYAQGTSVAPEQSRNEIERTLARYGADRFMYGWDHAGAVIGFEYHGRMIRFVLPLPDRSADEFWYTPARRQRRSERQAHEQWERACKQSWRSLALVIKAKLEAVAAGIVTFESEFLAHTVLPSGQTVAEWIEPQLEAAIADGIMPHLMLDSGQEN